MLIFFLTTNFMELSVLFIFFSLSNYYVTNTDLLYSDLLSFSKESHKRLYVDMKQSGEQNGAYKSLNYPSLLTKSHVHENIPKMVDWREKGMVSSVKNQKSCGACWAFSVVETIESMLALKGGKPHELSVQQVIDCAAGDNGCNGGWPCNTLEWLKNMGLRLVDEDSYPLTDTMDACKITIPSQGFVKVNNYTCANYGVENEQMLPYLIATHGPIVVSVDATLWKGYSGGIIQHNCEQKINHAVQVVGYDFTGDVPFYIVRNSWGDDWGDKGYLRIAYGKNLCGIANAVSYMDVI